MDVHLESDLIVNRLENKTNWQNKDMALLILAVNGIIPVKEPTSEDQVLPVNDVEIDETLS